MEEEIKDFQENPEEQSETLIITEDIRSYIYDTAKWTRFLAVIGFVFSAFTAMFAFSAPGILSTLATVEPTNPLLQLGSEALMLIFLIFALLYFYPSLLLFNFASAAKNAVLYADQEGLSTAMNKLKSFFKFWGVLMMVLILFYLFAILLSIVGGAALK
ncbi:DUF5362 family protein [Pedobacter sp. MC2016-14]|uniref:DUF5362 family protein n=1 Tax=Pedobacter sp. MC2016-14 TaxID=2897327 RepID=UPI001E5A47C6|nr:DUF5362 family protein [Pedobacter sp. MC2016-14]MCD0489220.1 DUF5362 family protein [Pedobacter sp. MC2016-14]